MTIAYDPEAGGRLITTADLEIADLLVSTATVAVSRTLYAVTWPQISRVRLWLGGGQVVDSAGWGVRARPLSGAMREDGDTQVVVYRRPGLSTTAAFKVRDHVLSGLGRSFDKPDVVAHAPGGGGQLVGLVARIAEMGEDRLFCPELVWSAFERAGASLDEAQPFAPTTVAVPQLWYQGTLLYVGHLFV
ncbi:hypothetical protein EYW49_13455 [Siculibacillus lacustris]|uniref:Uncharacterized protein n=1 Tax=Siculibacillus lacustris TaxID=1549641 RepID=A0A4Q9VMM8_9HYPH|nr:hypothetical protein [Siculibacillus lacustris]TBW36600.1 hypothetical protein EYW49_13455 [Siculibacillus lacustris]